MKLKVCFFLLLSSISFSQELSNTHFFFNPIIDVNEDEFVEAGLISNEYWNNSKQGLGVKGVYNLDNYTVSAELELDGLLTDSFEPSVFQIGGRYNFSYNNLKFSAGSLLNLTSSPSHDQYYISAFTATRYLVNENLDLAASFMLGPNENFDDLYSLLGFGAIYSISQKLNMLAEFNYLLSGNNVDFGLGLEYDISNMFDVRGGCFVNRLNGDVTTIYAGIVYNNFSSFLQN